jgi:hypothetical protein
MVEVPYPDDNERLINNIREELLAQRALSDLPITDQQIAHVAVSIASNVEYGFEVRWAPRWVKGDDPHHWVEGDEQLRYFMECLRHKRITMHESEAEAADWWAEHLRSEHS